MCLCCRSRQLGREYAHINSAILLPSLARLVWSGRGIFAVAGNIDPDERNLFLQGQVPHNRIRALAAELEIILFLTDAIRKSLNLDYIVFHATNRLREAIQPLDVFFA